MKLYIFVLQNIKISKYRYRNMKWIDKVKDKKTIIFVGESGCGKTELATNCAIELAKVYGEQKTVNLLDMDQTKGMFRSRDLEDMLSACEVSLMCGEHFLDTPVVPPGVMRVLKEEEYINVMDVGGNEMGAITMGQFAEEIRKTDNIVFYVINPYRILSLDGAHIDMMMQKIRDYGSVENFEYIANPNMGEYTDLEIALDGLVSAREAGDSLGIKYDLITLPEWLESLIKEDIDPIYIKRYLQYP